MDSLRQNLLEHSEEFFFEEFNQKMMNYLSILSIENTIQSASEFEKLFQHNEGRAIWKDGCYHYPLDALRKDIQNLLFLTRKLYKHVNKFIPAFYSFLNGSRTLNKARAHFTKSYETLFFDFDQKNFETVLKSSEMNEVSFGKCFSILGNPNCEISMGDYRFTDDYLDNMSYVDQKVKDVLKDQFGNKKISNFPIYLISYSLAQSQILRLDVIEAQSYDLRYHLHLFFSFLFYGCNITKKVADIFGNVLVSEIEPVPDFIEKKEKEISCEGYQYYLNNTEMFKKKYDGRWIATNGKDTAESTDFSTIQKLLVEKGDSNWFVAMIGKVPVTINPLNITLSSGQFKTEHMMLHDESVK